MSDPAANAPAIRLTGLSKRFPGFRLGPLDLEIESGVVVGLIGPNGAGKTTTLHCLAGLMVPDGGEAEIFGLRAGPDRPEARRSLGFVGEEGGFYRRWTVARNLALLADLVPGWSVERAGRLAERIALPLEKPVQALSRGDEAKLALVAALGHAPRLLVLDEPTSGLDPVVRAEVLDVLWELAEDGEHAVLYSTHVLSDIDRLADDLVFLREGRIVLRAGIDELSDAWRRISFRLSDGEIELPGVVEYRKGRTEHQVVTIERRRRSRGSRSSAPRASRSPG